MAEGTPCCSPKKIFGNTMQINRRTTEHIPENSNILLNSENNQKYSSCSFSENLNETCANVLPQENKLHEEKETSVKLSNQGTSTNQKMEELNNSNVPTKENTNQQQEIPFILSEEWVDIFERFVKSGNEDLIEIVKVIHIHPVFVWKSNRLNRVKLCALLSPYQFATQVIRNGDKYEFKLSKNHKKIFAYLIRDINNMKGDSWQEKWQNVIKGKPLKDINRKKAENSAPKKKLQVDKESSFKLPRPNQRKSSKRKFEELNNSNVPSKVYRSNEHSSLIRMDGISRNVKSVPLQDGQGICLNDEGNICVLDNGNGIHIYNENLEWIKTISFFVSSGVGLTFSNNTFYVATPLKNCVLKADDQTIQSKIFVPNPMSVRVHCGGTYILCGNNLTFLLGSEIIPIVLFEEKGSMVTFSDFVIVDNIAFILDSFAGDIYKYDLLTGDLNLAKIRENPPSGNPQCICSYEDKQILISETDNHKISSFFARDSGDHFQYIGDYPLENFQPNKITTKGKYIFTTALKDTRYQHQPPQSPPLNISTDNQDNRNDNIHSSAYQPVLSPFNSCEKRNLNSLGVSPLEIYSACIAQGNLKKLVEFILSSGVLLFQFITLPEEHLWDIKRVLNQLEIFRQIVYVVSEAQGDKSQFLQNWSQLFKIFNFLVYFKHLYSNSNSHLSMNLKEKHFDKTMKKENKKEEEEHYGPGRIVFVDSDKKFSFHKTDESISMGIICGALETPNNTFSINIFGSCLVQVFTPKQIQSVDERGMFVILNKNINEETNKQNIGEIISFGSMSERECNSYDLVGICALDKSSSDSTSLFLYSQYDEENKERIHFPIHNESENEEESCFVLMISLPMSASLLDLFIPTLGIQTIENSTPIGETEPLSTPKIIQSDDQADKESNTLHPTVETDINQLDFHLKMHETINEHSSKVYILYVTQLFC